MKQFVPMTDELLYRSGGPPAPLVPYHYGLTCFHGLDGNPSVAAPESHSMRQLARADTAAISAESSTRHPA